MSKIRTPRTRDAAMLLLERRSAVAGELAAITANRDAAIVVTNAAADTLAAPLIAEADALDAVLAAWWPSAAAELTGGKRKSVELGGCMVGTKLSRATLDHGFDSDDAAAAALKPLAWAKPYLRVAYRVDRAATLKALEGGRHETKLAELGFRRVPGDDRFFVEPVGQAGAAIDQPRG